MMMPKRISGECHDIGGYDNARVLGLTIGGATEVLYEGRVDVIDNWVLGEGVIFPISAIWRIEEVKP